MPVRLTRCVAAGVPLTLLGGSPLVASIEHGHNHAGNQVMDPFTVMASDIETCSVSHCSDPRLECLRTAESASRRFTGRSSRYLIDEGDMFKVDPWLEQSGWHIWPEAMVLYNFSQILLRSIYNAPIPILLFCLDISFSTTSPVITLRIIVIKANPDPANPRRYQHQQHDS